jgi:mRNA interferase MazF
MNEIKRGQIYYADLSPVQGSEQGGMRPVVIIQNDMGNKYSPTTIVAIVTSRHTKAKLPTHCWLETQCLPLNSMIELEQVRTIDKKRLCGYMGGVTLNDQKRIDKALKISLGIE